MPYFDLWIPRGLRPSGRPVSVYSSFTRPYNIHLYFQGSERAFECMYADYTEPRNLLRRRFLVYDFLWSFLVFHCSRFQGARNKGPQSIFFRHMTLLISYVIIPLYLSLLYLKGTKLSIFSAKVVNFWFSGKRKTLPFLSGRVFSFVWKWAALNNAYLCTLFKSVKLFFLPDFIELRLSLLFVWSIDYTQTHKKYTKVYLLFLSTFLLPIRGRHRFIPPRGDFPPFRSSKIYRVSMKKKYVSWKIKKSFRKGRKVYFRIWGLGAAGFRGFTMGHTVGVKVQKVQKVVVPYGAQILKKGGAAGAAGYVEGLCRKVRKMDGPYGPKGS